METYLRDAERHCVTCTWDHAMSPASTASPWTRPALTPAKQAVLDLPTPEGWTAELTWMVGYTPKEFSCLQTVTHPSSNRGLAQSNFVERYQRVNQHYTRPAPRGHVVRVWIVWWPIPLRHTVGLYESDLLPQHGGSDRTSFDESERWPCCVAIARPVPLRRAWFTTPPTTRNVAGTCHKVADELACCDSD